MPKRLGQMLPWNDMVYMCCNILSQMAHLETTHFLPPGFCQWWNFAWENLGQFRRSWDRFKPKTRSSSGNLKPMGPCGNKGITSHRFEIHSLDSQLKHSCDTINTIDSHFWFEALEMADTYGKSEENDQPLGFFIANHPVPQRHGSRSPSDRGSSGASLRWKVTRWTEGTLSGQRAA